MAILFLGCRNRFPFWRDALGLLRSTPEIVVQACSLMDQGILVRREALNGHSVFNIRPQSLIELSHLGSFILMDPG
jgi:hypothetical protein